VTPEPWAAPTREQRYDQLLQQAGAALIGAAPPGWRRIDLVVRVAAGVQDLGLSVVMADLTDVAVDPPAEAARALVELRELTATPELGAWFSARFVVDPPGEFRVHYNHDHDPLWDPPIPPDAFGRDLAAHPRPAARIPGWLRRRLDPTAAAAAGVGADPDRIPPAPLGVEQQRELQREVTDLLVLRAPADRGQVRVMFRAAGTHVDVVGHVLGLDGRLRGWEPPPEVRDLLRRLRAGMYRPGVGTWSAAAIVVEYPMRTTFDFRDDPRWRQPPPRTAVLDELEMFPRSPEAVTAWMKDVVPAAERVAEVAGRFRHARIFDRRDPAGRPVVDRPPVPAAERDPVLAYLNTAPVVLGGRGFDPDVFDPDGPADVPAAFHTDGTWIWPAAVPHHLAEHGVPPEPELVAHLRAHGFTPPQVDAPTRAAAYTALTGEVPTPAPPSTPTPATPTPTPTPTPAAAAAGRGAELDERERSVLAIVERRVSEAGAIPEAYRLLGSREGATCLERVDDGWQVADYERGRPRNPQRFAHLWDAGAYLLGVLTLTPSSLRAGGGDRNTAHAVNDWPVQPLPGEPPLTLLADKHIAVLMPGRELVRHGAPTGNLTFAAGTAFDAMSLRAEREQQGPHHYRVVRELRTLSGRTVPWHDRPGGGTAYLLPEAVERHVANGGLTPLTTAPGS
jgi:hypothetical protein